MAKKSGFIGAMDDLPFWAKILFCIPMLDIVWAVYRIVKGATEGNVLTLVVGILWIIPGCAICWLVDLISTILWGAPKFFA